VWKLPGFTAGREKERSGRGKERAIIPRLWLSRYLEGECRKGGSRQCKICRVTAQSTIPGNDFDRNEIIKFSQVFHPILLLLSGRCTQ